MVINADRYKHSRWESRTRMTKTQLTKTFLLREIFNIILDSITTDMTLRFESVRYTGERFSLLRSSKETTINQIQGTATV